MAEDTPRKTVEELRSLFDLTGKVAVVTGAGGTLGHALCKGLAAYGADIAGWDMKTDIMDDMVAEVEGIGRKATATYIRERHRRRQRQGRYGEGHRRPRQGQHPGDGGRHRRQPSARRDLRHRRVAEGHGRQRPRHHAVRQVRGRRVREAGQRRQDHHHSARSAASSAIPAATRPTAPPRAPCHLHDSSSWPPSGPRYQRQRQLPSPPPSSGPRSRSRSADDPELVKIFMARIPMGQGRRAGRLHRRRRATSPPPPPTTSPASSSPSTAAPWPDDGDWTTSGRSRYRRRRHAWATGCAMVFAAAGLRRSSCTTSCRRRCPRSRRTCART